MRAMLMATTALTTVLLAAACGTTPPDGVTGPSPDPAATSPSRTVGERAVPSRMPTPFTLPPTGAPVTGEVPPDVLASVVADAASRAGTAEADVVVVRGESVTWSDGSLGCPQPGMSYTQAITPGYWVVLDVAGTEYDYRATARGSFVLCEGGGGPPLGTPTR